MRQIIIGGYYDALHVSNTEYNSISCGYSWETITRPKFQIVASAGTIRNLRVELNDVPGTGTYTFTLYHYKESNGMAWGDSTLTCTVAADGTIASDTAHDVSVSAGDSICLKCVPDSPDNARYARWTVEFEGSTANESLILGVTSDAVSSSATEYIQIATARTSWSATENKMRQVIPTAGKIKNLYVSLSTDPGTAPDAYRFTLRVNGANSDDGEGNPLQCTITANDTTGNDTSHEITVAAGNIVTLQCEPLESPSATPGPNWGMTFLADTNGESFILGGSDNNPSISATEYRSLNAGEMPSWTATESNVYQLAQECTLKKLYVLLESDPGGTDKYTFTVRYDGGSPASGLVVEIAGGSTTGNDTSNTISVLDGKTVNMMVVPTDTPAYLATYWGLVCFIAAVTDFERSLSTTMGLNTVALTRAVTYARSLTTNMRMSVSLSRIQGHIRSLSTAIGLDAITLTRAVGYSRSLTTNMRMSVSLTRVVTYVRSLTTNMRMSVSLSRVQGFVRSLSTSMGLDAVALTRVAGYARSLTTNIGMSVTVSRSWGHVRTLTTAIGMFTYMVWRGKFKRRIQSIGTNRTIGEVGTNRDVGQVGTNRDIEEW